MYFREMFIWGYIFMCVWVCVCVLMSLYIYMNIKRIISKGVLFSSGSDLLQLFLPHACNISYYNLVRAQSHPRNHQHSAKLKLIQWVHPITSVPWISNCISEWTGQKNVSNDWSFHMLNTFSRVTDLLCVSFQTTTRRLEFANMSFCVKISW